MGMLATVMNAIALAAGARARGVPARLFSAVPMPTICETFTQQRAERRLRARAGWSCSPAAPATRSSPPTTGAALRAAEMGCDALFKGTQVDGVYSADPKKDPKATRYDRLTHDEVLAQGPRGHGCRRGRPCPRQRHSDNRLFDSRARRFRRYTRRAAAGRRSSPLDRHERTARLDR